MINSRSLIIWEDAALRYAWPTDDIHNLFNVSGEVFRQEKTRKTLRFSNGNKNYFLKIHMGAGWKEIIKNLLQGRLPVLGAQQEWRALKRLNQLGIPTMSPIGHGIGGVNPARLKSFIVTEEITNSISLEDFCCAWSVKRPSFILKRALIFEVAKMASLMHSNGINHRDFYLCHFLLDHQLLKNEKLKLYLIDLHRVQLRKKTPIRWIIKDLAGLYFSSMDLGLTNRDLLRFIKHYHSFLTKDCLPKKLRNQNRFWQKVKIRAQKLYRKVNEQ